MSRRFYLDASTLKAYFRRPDLGILQVARAHLCYASELVGSRTKDNVYLSFGASNPLSTLIESERDVRGIEIAVASLLPGTVRAAEYRMGVSTSKEGPVRRKGKKVLSHSCRATGCHDPRPDQSFARFANRCWRCASSKKQGSQCSDQSTGSNRAHESPLFVIAGK
jgi:hypothetical protein